MSYPIFKQNCADTITAFRKGLSDEQFRYVLERYREYTRFALGRPNSYEGDLFSSPYDVWGREMPCVSPQSCLNMRDSGPLDMGQAYSDSLLDTFGVCGRPFRTFDQELSHSIGYSNPVRLAWMFSVLGVEVSGELLGELEAILWDEDFRGLSMCGKGLCERLPDGSYCQLSKIFLLIGLSSYFPFGEGVYEKSSYPYLVVVDGLMDPRRFTFLIATVILGHWQNGTIDQAPVPGSKKWDELAVATYGLTADDPNQLDFFAEVFGIRESNKERLWYVVGPFYDSDEISIDRPVKPLWKTLRKLFGYPMLSIMLLLILFGTCGLGSIIAHYLEHSHLAR